MKIDKAAIAQSLKKNAPRIGFGAGMILMAVSIVHTAIQSPKFHPTIKEHTDELTKIQMEAETGVITDAERNKKVLNRLGRTVASAIKAYGLPALEFFVGTTLVTVSFVETDHRWTNSAALATVTAASFAKYRNNIIENCGKEADTKAMYSVKEETAKDENGEEKVIYKVNAEEVIPSEWAIFIDRNEKDKDGNYVHERDLGYLLAQLASIEQAMNRKMKDSIDGSVSMADLYSLLQEAPKDENTLRAMRVSGQRFRRNIDKLDDNGLPNKFKIYILTVYPKPELVPVTQLQREYTEHMLECNRTGIQKPFDRLDEDGNWIDFTKPEMII